MYYFRVYCVIVDRLAKIRMFTFVCYRCCQQALRDVPMVLVSADPFLGDLRMQLAKKLPKTAGVARDRLIVTVTN